MEFSPLFSYEGNYKKDGKNSLISQYVLLCTLFSGTP
jgi:hypothetical protein